MHRTLVISPLLLLACKGPSDTPDPEHTGDTVDIYTLDCGEEVWDWDLEDCVPARCGEGRFGATWHDSTLLLDAAQGDELSLSELVSTGGASYAIRQITSGGVSLSRTLGPTSSSSRSASSFLRPGWSEPHLDSLPRPRIDHLAASTPA